MIINNNSNNNENRKFPCSLAYIIMLGIQESCKLKKNLNVTLTKELHTRFKYFSNLLSQLSDMASFHSHSYLILPFIFLKDKVIHKVTTYGNSTDLLLY